MTDTGEAAINQVNQFQRLPKSAHRKLWDREYAQYNSIPSSDRDDPSRALMAAQSQLEYTSIDVAVDIGCGNGRNAVYLANKGVDVIALDFSTEAVAQTKRRVAQSSVSGSVEVLLSDITVGIPVADNSIDLVVDSYFSCHLIGKSILNDYFSQVRRVIKSDGQLYWAGLGTRDEYYQNIIDSHPSENIIVDPINDIPKRLYDIRYLDVELPFEGSPVLATELLFEDTVSGDSYQRSIVSAVFDS